MRRILTVAALVSCLAMTFACASAPTTSARGPAISGSVDLPARISPRPLDRRLSAELLAAVADSMRRPLIEAGFSISDSVLLDIGLEALRESNRARQIVMERLKSELATSDCLTRVGLVRSSLESIQVADDLRAQIQLSLEGALCPPEAQVVNLLASRIDHVIRQRLVSAQGLAAQPKENLKDDKDPVPAPMMTPSASWEDALVRGLATVVERRARATLLAASMELARTEVCDSARIYLAVTCALIEPIDPYTTPIGWEAVASALRLDLERLPVRLMIAGDAAVPERYVVGVVAEALYAVQRGEPLPEILAGARTLLINQSSPVAQTALRLSYAVEIVAQGTPGAEPNPLWIDAAIAQLEHEAEQPGAFKNLGPTLEALRREINWIRTHAVLADSLRRVALANLSDTTNVAAEVFAQRYDLYMAAAARILQHLPAFVPSDAPSDVRDRMRSVASAAQHFNGALSSVRAGAYGAAVSQTLLAVRTVSPQWNLPSMSYTIAAAEIASARDREEMAAALESFASPVGGHRQKARAAGVNINAYLGGMYSWDEELDEGDVDGAAYGLFAPIGLELHTSAPGPLRSIGLFGSILDLGTVFTVREVRDTTYDADGNAVGTVRQEAEFGLSQVVSPGLYLTIGFVDSWPVTVGVGASIVPELRSVRSDADGVHDAASVRRWLFFVAADLPLFRFR